MKTVFLLADIGFGKNNLYHVGDEAMFLSNVEQYKKIGWEINASSRSISHQNLKINEYLDIYILNLSQFLLLIFKSICLKTIGLNTFPTFFKPTINSLIESDILHISGGGNITSLWQGHIFYRSFMIFTSWLFNKKIILTSQTIGPINNIFHKIILNFVLNEANYLGIRDKDFSMEWLRKLSITPKNTHFNYDDALFWLNTNNSSRNKKTRLGISLHDPKDINITKEFRKMFLSEPFRKINLEIVLIPHFLDSKNLFDVKYMKSLFPKSDIGKIKVIDYKLLDLKNKKHSIASKIKLETNKMDLVIASRYHGLVFAISSSIPCLSINYDMDYYKGKNTGLLKLFTKHPNDFIIDFENIKSDYILSKFKNLLKRRFLIHKELKKALNEAEIKHQKTQNRIYRLEQNTIQV